MGMTSLNVKSHGQSKILTDNNREALVIEEKLQRETCAS